MLSDGGRGDVIAVPKGEKDAGVKGSRRRRIGEVVGDSVGGVMVFVA
jgi:hypothetical protein